MANAAAKSRVVGSVEGAAGTECVNRWRTDREKHAHDNAYENITTTRLCQSTHTHTHVHIFFPLKCSTTSPTTLPAPPLPATRLRLLRPIEPRLAARLDAIVAIPQPQSSPDSRPARNAVLSEQLQPAHHRPPQRSSSRPDVDLTSHDAAEAAVLDLRSSEAATSCYWSPPSSQSTPQLPQPVAPGPLHLPAALTATATAPPG